MSAGAALRPADAALIERYLEHVRVEKRLAARTVTLYVLDLEKLGQFAVQDDVGLPVLQLAADEVATLGSGNIRSKSDNTGDRLNWYQIDAWQMWGEQSRKVVQNDCEVDVPTMTLFTGMYLAATCSQPPGAAHRSIVHLAFSRKPYFLFSWINLKAERARYPCSLPSA